MEKGSKFVWTPECQLAFHTLQSKLTSPPILAFPDFTVPFILDTDASDCGIGAVLSQIQEGHERVVAYASRALSKSERNYSVTRRELLAVITFVSHFRQYLLGNTFTLRTDHKWLNSFKEPEGQVARWLEKLAEFSFKIEHRPGRKHSNADSLSRVLPAFSAQFPSELLQLSVSELRELQLQDNTIAPVLEAKESNSKPDGDSISQYSLETRRLFQMWDQLVIENGILIRLFIHPSEGKPTTKQMVTPKCLHQSILESLHAGTVGGHLGQAKTLSKLKMRFYWPGHYRDVDEWCHTCPTCATRKTPTPHQRGGLQNVTVGSPMQLVAVDLLGPFPTSKNGNNYLLVAMDYFTKWGEAYPIPNMELIH